MRLAPRIAVAAIAALVPVASGFSSSPGCPAPESELAQARFNTLAGIQEVLAVLYNSPDGYVVPPLESLVASFEPYIHPNITLFVEGGPGLYKGITGVVEYVTIPMPAMNYDKRRHPSQEILGIEAVGPDVLLSQVRAHTQWFGRRYNVSFDIDTRFTFAPCSPLVFDWYVSMTPSFGQYLGFEVYSSNYSKYEGAYDICMFHEEYCGDPEYRQYADFDACVALLSDVPLVSTRCGDRLITGGHSITCRVKHKSMVALNRLHCFHIGPPYRDDGSPNRDPDGARKCSDEEECPTAANGPIDLDGPDAAILAAIRAWDEDIERAGANETPGYKFPVIGES